MMNFVPAGGSRPMSVAAVADARIQNNLPSKGPQQAQEFPHQLPRRADARACGARIEGTVKAAARGQFALTNLLAIPIESRAARAGGSLDVVRERRGRRSVWFGRFHFDSSPGDLDFIWTRVVSVDSPPARLQGQGSHRQSHRAHRGRHWHYPDFGDAQGTGPSQVGSAGAGGRASAGRTYSTA